jgi:hypothetical protein
LSDRVELKEHQAGCGALAFSWLRGRRKWLKTVTKCRRVLGTLATTGDPKLKNHRGSGTTSERGSCLKESNEQRTPPHQKGMEEN